MNERPELDELQEEFPGWRFGTTWATSNSACDRRKLTATRNGILLIAWDAFEMRRKLKWEEHGHS